MEIYTILCCDRMVKYLYILSYRFQILSFGNEVIFGRKYFILINLNYWCPNIHRVGKKLCYDYIIEGCGDIGMKSIFSKKI